MNSAYNRGYSIFYMAMTAFCTVAAVGAIMAALYKLDPEVDFEFAGISKFGYTNRKFEEAEFLFNISADFSKQVHVNTRLFYSYIEAEWNYGKDEHKSILWNQLVYREQPKVSVTNLPGNFTFRQVGPSMKGKDVKLTFKFQMVPFIGFFRTVSLKSINVTLPTKYIA